jgi:glycosyltransferase involved in cell wall biosynthesis
VNPLLYSVVAPMHNESGNVLPLYRDLKATLDTLGDSYEMIFVNDCSTDETLSEMMQIQSRDKHFHFVDLAANVGENWALLAGLSKASGDIVITIDGDYQNDPAYIPRLLEELSRGFRVVSGRRRKRSAEFWTRRLPSQIANFMIRLVSGVPVHDCGCGLKAYRREVLEDKYVPKGFMNRFSPVCLGVTRQEFSEVEIIDRPRATGQSHYGLERIFAVIRDLWALPFALRGASLWLTRFRWALVLCVVGGFFLALTGWWLFAGMMFLLAVTCASNVANLARFVRAQKQPEFSIKQFK